MNGQISPHLNLLETLECPHDGKLSEDLDLLPVVQVSRHEPRRKKPERGGDSKVFLGCNLLAEKRAVYMDVSEGFDLVAVEFQGRSAS